MNLRLRLSIVITIALATALVGCSDDGNPTAPSGSTARVNFVQASPDALPADLLVDGVIERTALTFPNDTGYRIVPSGARNVKVNVSGTSTTLLYADLRLTAGTAYSVFAIDSVSRIAPLVLVDSLKVPAAGKARVRFVHLSPNAPAVDIGITGGGVVFSNKSFKGFTDFTPLDAGTYNLEVRLAGTSTVVLPLPGIALQAGKIYTVFARGFVGGAGAQALGAEIDVNN